MESQRGFHDRREPRGRAGVADVGFGAPDGAGDGARAIEGLRQGASFGRVFGQVAAAVGFEVADRGRVDAGFSAGALHGPLVRGRRGDERVGPFAGRSADAADDGVDAIAVPQRIVVAFEHHGGGAFADERVVRIGPPAF